MNINKNITKAKLLILIVIALSILGCKSENEVKSASSKLVKLYEIEDLTTTKVRNFAGSVVEGKKANLSFRISAPIEKILVEEGQFVDKGQVIAKLDARDYQLQYQAVKAQYEQISNEVERIETLYNKGNISENEYEKAKSGLEQITAKYESVENSLEDIELIAPYSAFIQDIFFQEGEIVKAGLPVISIIGDKDFQIECDIPALVYVNRDKFSSFTVILETSPKKKIPLELLNIKHKSNLNSLYGVYFKLSNSAEIDSRLAVGMDCEVEITYELEIDENERVIKVPIESIVQKAGESFVWLCNENSEGKYIVNKRVISIVGIDDSGFVLISDGLRAGDKIVKAGVHELKDKQEVEPVKEITPTNYGGLL